MPKKAEKDKEKRSPPPTAGLAFIVGFTLFAGILAPGGLLLSYITGWHLELGIRGYQAHTIGCIAGLIIAIIPALIFMRLTMKRVMKQRAARK